MAKPATFSLLTAASVFTLCFIPSQSGSLTAFAAEQHGSTKVASFAPSNTELIYSIGASDKLAGVCSYCDYPEAAKKKLVVGNFISANLERLASLKPDRIVLVSGQETLANLLTHNGYKVTLLHNDHISDISKNLRELSLLSNDTARGDKAARTFDSCVAELKTITAKATTRPAVFYCVWPQPLLTLGKASYLTEVITACGGDSISHDLPAGYPHFSLEKLVIANPDVMILPYEIKDPDFLKKHPWSSLKAVKSNHVYFLPDPPHDGLARPTMRLTNGFYWLAKKIHPELGSQLDAWYARTQPLIASFAATDSDLKAEPEGKKSQVPTPAR